VADWWFSSGTPVFCTNKNDCHNITEILLKLALNTISEKKTTSNNIMNGIMSRNISFIFDHPIISKTVEIQPV
jgi:hypothetical protein